MSAHALCISRGMAIKGERLGHNLKLFGFSHESFLREYLRLLPFGYSVASTFISLLHVPLDGSFTPEIIEGDEAFAEMLRRGGEPVDRELAALIHDMYQLKKRFEC